MFGRMSWTVGHVWAGVGGCRTVSGRGSVAAGQCPGVGQWLPDICPTKYQCLNVEYLSDEISVCLSDICLTQYLCLDVEHLSGEISMSVFQIRTFSNFRHSKMYGMTSRSPIVDILKCMT